MARLPWLNPATLDFPNVDKALLETVERSRHDAIDVTLRVRQEEVLPRDRLGIAQLVLADDPPLDKRMPQHAVLAHRKAMALR